MLRNLSLIALLVTVACDGKPVQATPAARRTLADSADQVMYNATTTITANGAKRGDITGDTVATFDQMTRVAVLQMRVQFATPLGRPLALLTAPVGLYSVTTGVLRTQRGGDVTIQSDTARRRITTTAVMYDAATNQISGDNAFVATSGSRTMRGTGFTADPGLFSIKCKSSCQGTLGP
jgi:hypothetical protein